MMDNTNFYEGCGKEGLIKCIFLSEFHISLGSNICVQYPNNFISKEIFYAVNVYIIPKPKALLCKTLTVNTLNYKIIGYPVKIDNQKYVRNSYYFNLCFVCDHWAKSARFEPVIKKLAEYFTLLEEEHCFLSSSSNYDKIQAILQQTLQELNEKQVTTIVEGETTIYLKIVNSQKSPEDPPEVLDHHVPELNEPYTEIPLDHWDLTSQQILPYLNGENHVAKISALSDVENLLVKACVQNLVYYGAVSLSPLIKYSNRYICTRNLSNLVKDPKLFLKCRDYVTIRTPSDDEENSPKKPSLYKIFQIFSSMQHGVSLRTLCERFEIRNENIDERSLVSFGLKHKLIRIINKYPVFIGGIPTGRRKLYNGFFTIDEICCKTGLSPAQIESEIDLDSSVTVIWK